MNKELGLSILHSRISHPNRPEYASYEQGVAVIIFNRRGEVLLGQETQEDKKYGRAKDQLNIFTETGEPGERIKATVERGLREELGSDIARFRVIDGSYRETNEAYVARMGYEYKYRCICLLWPEDPDIPAHVSFLAPPEEIKSHRWVHPTDLDMFDVEEGARLVIAYYCAQETIRQLFDSGQKTR